MTDGPSAGLDGATPLPSDRSLLRRLRGGSQDAATQLYYKYAKRLRALARASTSAQLARRVDAGFLAGLVAEHRLPLDEAVETAVDLAYHLPKAAYPAPPAVS